MINWQCVSGLILNWQSGYRRDIKLLQIARDTEEPTRLGVAKYDITRGTSTVYGNEGMADDEW
jgi:hypothetical protein